MEKWFWCRFLKYSRNQFTLQIIYNHRIKFEKKNYLFAFHQMLLTNTENTLSKNIFWFHVFFFSSMLLGTKACFFYTKLYRTHLNAMGLTHTSMPLWYSIPFSIIRVVIKDFEKRKEKKGFPYNKLKNSLHIKYVKRIFLKKRSRKWEFIIKFFFL